MYMLTFYILTKVICPIPFRGGGGGGGTLLATRSKSNNSTGTQSKLYPDMFDGGASIWPDF